MTRDGPAGDSMALVLQDTDFVACLESNRKHTRTHTHTYIHIYICLSVSLIVRVIPTACRPFQDDKLNNQFAPLVCDLDIVSQRILPLDEVGHVLHNTLNLLSSGLGICTRAPLPAFVTQAFEGLHVLQDDIDMACR